MTTTAMTFAFEGKGVRFVGTPDRPEWVASDVCACLGLNNHRQALAKIPDDEKGVTLRDTPGGSQKIRTVYEPGLYRLIFKSEKPEAERFKKWVFAEVLPKIRQTGSYSAGLVEKIESLEERFDACLGLLTLERKARLSQHGYGLRKHQLDTDKRKRLERQAGLGQQQTSLSFEADPVNRIAEN